MATAAPKVISLDPAAVQVVSNTRFSLKPERISELAASIAAHGSVHTPIFVKPAVNGGTYPLIAGHYRLAAVLDLNKAGAGLSLPAIVVKTANDAEALGLQLSENMDRENQSPMDRAIAIQALEAAGVSRGDVRKRFAVVGGRKGMTAQPASNSFINMHLSFLDLPVSIQAKIHAGVIGVAAAYSLTKFEQAEQEAIVAKIEAQLAKEEALLEKAEKEDAKLNAKANAAQEAAETAQKDFDATAAELEAVQKTLAEKTAAVEELASTPYLKLDAEGKKALAEKLGVAKTEQREAKKTADKLSNKLTTVDKKLQTAKAKVAGEEEEPKPAAPAKAKPAVTPAKVREAAAEVGAKAKTDEPQLKIGEVKAGAVKLSKSSFAKVKAIGLLLLGFIDGKVSAGTLENSIAVQTGERKLKKA